MNLSCLLTGHIWVNSISLEKTPTDSLSVNGTTYTGIGLFDFGIKRKRVCKKCGSKQFLAGVDWKKEPLTKKELRDEKIKKLLK
jgi:hypothetical protein